MFLSAHSHMPIFPFISVDDDFMIQACKNNTSLTVELSAISKCVLVITHTCIQAVHALSWLREYQFVLPFSSWKELYLASTYWGWNNASKA